MYLGINMENCFWMKKQSYFHEILKLDVTELSGLDDLHSPEGVIRDAEDLLSQLYGTERSYFLVNGSTVGNLAMIMATLNENDVVLVQRNCHKSVLNAIQLTHAKAVFLDPIFHHNWGVAGGVSEQLVNEALDLYPNVKAMIFTYPNYYGMVNELEEIIELAHARQIPVLVDEAHGAHFISGGSFPKSAIAKQSKEYLYRVLFFCCLYARRAVLGRLYQSLIIRLCRLNE